LEIGNLIGATVGKGNDVILPNRLGQAALVWAVEVGLDAPEIDDLGSVVYYSLQDISGGNAWFEHL
jgi:hypothetical protein